MNGTEVMLGTRPKELHLLKLHRAGYVAGTTHQAGLANSQDDTLGRLVEPLGRWRFGLVLGQQKHDYRFKYIFS
jgi:hypothetical protein